MCKGCVVLLIRAAPIIHRMCAKTFRSFDLVLQATVFRMPTLFRAELQHLVDEEKKTPMAMFSA